MKGFTFDAGGLIALERNDRRVTAMVRTAIELGAPITIPATALAQVIRNPSRQARLARLIRHTVTRIAALDGQDATEVGMLLARTGTADIADAHVAVCASRAGQAVLTSDPDDLRTIAPELMLVVI